MAIGAEQVLPRGSRLAAVIRVTIPLSREPRFGLVVERSLRSRIRLSRRRHRFRCGYKSDVREAPRTSELTLNGGQSSCRHRALGVVWVRYSAARGVHAARTFPSVSPCSYHQPRRSPPSVRRSCRHRYRLQLKSRHRHHHNQRRRLQKPGCLRSRRHRRPQRRPPRRPQLLIRSLNQPTRPPPPRHPINRRQLRPAVYLGAPSGSSVTMSRQRTDRISKRSTRSIADSSTASSPAPPVKRAIARTSSSCTQLRSGSGHSTS